MGQIISLLPETAFLLEWLSKEDVSQLGECRGPAFDDLLRMGFAEFVDPPSDTACLTGYEGVRATDAGREWLKGARPIHPGAHPAAAEKPLTLGDIKDHFVNELETCEPEERRFLGAAVHALNLVIGAQNKFDDEPKPSDVVRAGLLLLGLPNDAQAVDRFFGELIELISDEPGPPALHLVHFDLMAPDQQGAAASWRMVELASVPMSGETVTLKVGDEEIRLGIVGRMHVAIDGQPPELHCLVQRIMPQAAGGLVPVNKPGLVMPGRPGAGFGGR